MPVEKRPVGTRSSAPAATANPPAVAIPRFHLRLPDVSKQPGTPALPAPHEPSNSPAKSAVKQVSFPATGSDAKRRPAPPRDSLAEARAKLSEKRFADGQREVTSMIEGLRDKRHRLFRRLWTASVLLTVLSVVALSVELLKKSELLKSFSDSGSTDGPSVVRKARKAGSSDSDKLPAKSESPRVWSNGLPSETPDEPSIIERVASEKAVIEQIGHIERQGAWLPGTISDTDSESPDRGDIHDDHQSRTP